MRKNIITKINDKILCFTIENNNLEDIYPYENDIVGNIYLARVTNYIGSLKSAFVNLGGLQAYLKLSRHDSIKNGDLVLVQVVKQNYDNKMYGASTKISIKGDYVIVKYGEAGFGVSNKIKSLNSKRYNKIYEEIRRDKFFVLFRTASNNAQSSEIIADINNVYEKLEIILKKARFESSPRLLYEDSISIRDKDGSFITDIEEVYQEMKDKYNIELYSDDYPLSNIYELNSKIKKLLNKRVHLKNSANIVIEKTEALTVIDVNSAKSIVDNKTNISAIDVNKIAAIECLKQIRLRNISGIILIDFLNMDSIQNEEIIEIILKEAEKDRCKIRVYGFTKLGILEMSRQRERVSLEKYLGV